MPGLPPFVRGPYATMYVQQPWTIRQYAGFSTAEDSQRLLSAQPRGRADGPLDRLRSRDAPRLRQRPSARRRRRRHGGRRDRLDPRHAHPVRRHPARPDERVDDDERRGAADPRALHRRRRRAGRPAREARRDHPERHPQGVHGPQHVHLSARALDADHRATSSRTPSQKMPKFNSISICGYHMQEAGATADLELGYTLADGLEYVRTGIAAGLDVDAFAPRLSFFWAIGMNFFMEVAKLRAARLLWAEARQAVRRRRTRSRMALRTHCQTSGWSLTAQDVYNNVVRTCIEAMAATQGHTQIAAHQLARRGARAADATSARASPATRSSICSRRAAPTRVDRSVGRQLLRRAPHARARAARAGRTSRRSRRSAAWPRRSRPGVPKLRIEEAAARTQARIDSGQQTIVGVNKYQLDERGRARGPQGRQRARCARRRSRGSQKLRSERDERDVERALDGAHRARPRRARATCSSSRSTPRARARPSARSASRSRRSAGRHEADDPRASRACTVARWARTSDDVARSASRARTRSLEREGRRPRILVAKMGQDGHDRGAEGDRDRVRRPRLRRRRRAALPDAGGDRAPGGRERRARRRRELARRRPPHAGARAARRRSTTLGREDILVVVGGVIPPQDYDALCAAGAAAIFGPGTVIAEGARAELARQARERASAGSRDRRAMRRRCSRRRSTWRACARGDRARARRARSRSSRASAPTHADARAGAARRGSCRTPATRGASASPACRASARARSSTRSACTCSARGKRVAVLAVDPSSARHRRQHPRRQDAHGAALARAARVHPAVADGGRRSAASRARRARRCWSARPRASTSCSSRPSASGRARPSSPTWSTSSSC